MGEGWRRLSHPWARKGRGGTFRLKPVGDGIVRPAAGGEKRVPLGGGRGDAQSLCWWTPSLATPKEPLESPGPVPPPTPITRPKAQAVTAGLLSATEHRRSSPRGPASGHRGAGGVVARSPGMLRSRPGLLGSLVLLLGVPSHLSGSREHQSSRAQAIPWVVSG